MPSRSRRQAGFTLLEVLIVVVVISILAALIIPQMAGAADSAKLSRILQGIDVLRTAVQTHYADTGRLAVEYSDSINDTERTLTLPQAYSGWKGPYLAHPLSDADNPYGGTLRIYDQFNVGPTNPSGFDLIGRGTDTATNDGQWAAFTDISETVAQEIDATVDRHVQGDWRSTGRVEWNRDTLMVFLMDISD